MLGLVRNEIGKRAVASSCDAAGDEELVAAARNALMITFLLIAALTILAFLCVTGPDSAIRTKHDQ